MSETTNGTTAAEVEAVRLAAAALLMFIEEDGPVTAPIARAAAALRIALPAWSDERRAGPVPTFDPAELARLRTFRAEIEGVLSHSANQGWIALGPVRAALNRARP